MFEVAFWSTGTPPKTNCSNDIWQWHYYLDILQTSLQNRLKVHSRHTETFLPRPLGLHEAATDIDGLVLCDSIRCWPSQLLQNKKRNHLEIISLLQQKNQFYKLTFTPSISYPLTLCKCFQQTVSKFTFCLYAGSYSNTSGGWVDTHLVGGDCASLINFWVRFFMPTVIKIAKFWKINQTYLLSFYRK